MKELVSLREDLRVIFSGIHHHFINANHDDFEYQEKFVSSSTNPCGCARNQGNSNFGYNEIDHRRRCVSVRTRTRKFVAFHGQRQDISGLALGDHLLSSCLKYVHENGCLFGKFWNFRKIKQKIFISHQTVRTVAAQSAIFFLFFFSSSSSSSSYTTMWG